MMERIRAGRPAWLVAMVIVWAIILPGLFTSEGGKAFIPWPLTIVLCAGLAVVLVGLVYDVVQQRRERAE